MKPGTVTASEMRMNHVKVCVFFLELSLNNKTTAEEKQYPLSPFHLSCAQNPSFQLESSSSTYRGVQVEVKHITTIISETVQVVPIKLSVKIVPLKVCTMFSQPDDLDLHSRSQLCLKLDTCFNCTIIVIFLTMFKL